MELGVVHRADAPCYYPEPKREWVGLTDDEIHTCWNDTMCTPHYSREDIYRAIETKLKEKNA